MGPDLIPEWDSLGTINLLNRFQETFNISLGLEDAAQISSLGEFLRILEENESKN
jgi:acyl carrier protein|tara:strand:+ start:356 stop:520 length:165 start_codon:yes stop_codon:yes gene_type:complete